jgi:hypothetical protein
MLTNCLIHAAILAYSLAPSVGPSLLAARGGHNDVGSQTMPSPWYLNDDVQYYPPTAAAAAALREETAAAKVAANAKTQVVLCPRTEARVAGNAVLPSQPFCKKCAASSDVKSPLPKSIRSFRVDVEKLTVRSADRGNDRIPVPYGYLTAEFEQTLAEADNTLAGTGNGAKLGAKPACRWLFGCQSADADTVSYRLIGLDPQRNQTTEKVCRTAMENYVGRSANGPSLPVDLPELWPDDSDGARHSVAKTQTYTLFDFPAMMSCYDPAMRCYDPSRLYYCREELVEYSGCYSPTDPADSIVVPPYFSDIGRFNNVSNSGDGLWERSVVDARRPTFAPDSNGWTPDDCFDYQDAQRPLELDR